MRYTILFKLLFIISILFILGSEDITQNKHSLSLKEFSAHKQYRAWQGISIDEKFIYLVTDRNEHFQLENIISIYTYDGNLVKEYNDIYSAGDSNGKFMSFGASNIIDHQLYITAYNLHGGGFPLESKVLVFSTKAMKLIREHDIGGGVAESITKYKQR